MDSWPPGCEKVNYLSVVLNHPQCADLPWQLRQADISWKPQKTTPWGALFGEAVVIMNEALKRDFRYSIKQHGGMLAKGRLLGLQFATLFTGNLYFDIAQHAIDEAMRIKAALQAKGIGFLIDSPTNQQFPIFTDTQIATLSEHFMLSLWQRIDEEHTAMRICTSWGTKRESTDALIRAIENL